MASTSDFRNGFCMEYNNGLWTISEFLHVKPGKGNQFTRTKMQNMLTGSNLEKTFKSGEKFEVPDVMTRDCQFLYAERILRPWPATIPGHGPWRSRVADLW